MIIVDYTNMTVLISMIVFLFVMNFIGYFKKKALFVLIATMVSTAMMIIHFLLRDMLAEDVFKFNMYVDFATIAVNLSMLLIVDEIEVRRNVIGKVFESKYNNK